MSTLSFCHFILIFLLCCFWAYIFHFFCRHNFLIFLCVVKVFPLFMFSLANFGRFHFFFQRAFATFCISLLFLALFVELRLSFNKFFYFHRSSKGSAYSHIWLEFCIELVFYFGWDSYVLSRLGVLLYEFDIKAQNYKGEKR